MNQNDIFADIKKSIIENFSFLKSYGFEDFVENHIAYESHFKTKNKCVSIDIWFEEIYSSPIWITINEYHIEYLEFENLILKECEKKRSEKYANINSESLQKCYEDGGKLINELYFKACSDIIKRNIQVLNGDLEILKQNTEKIRHKNEQLKIDDKKNNKIYTLEFQLYPNGCIDDASAEFESLEELDSFLMVRNDIKKYRIFDWNMNEIKRT